MTFLFRRAQNEALGTTYGLSGQKGNFEAMKTVYVKPKSLNRCEACGGLVIDGGIVVQTEKTTHVFCSYTHAGVWAIENKQELTHIGYFSSVPGGDNGE